MRLLEGVFLGFALFGWIGSFLPKQIPPLYLFALAVAGGLLGLVEGLTEGVRFQLYPAYFVLGVVALSAALAWRRSAKNEAPKARRRWPRVVLFILGLCLVALSAALAVMLPVFSFESPRGPFAVGVTSYEWTDESRTDEHPKTPSGHRRLGVKIWYPAAPSNSAKEPYFSPTMARGTATALKLPSFALSHLALVSTYQTPEAPLAAGGDSFPILLFSHGYPGSASQSTFELEELASHGYVVVGINHTYDTPLAVFNDGSTVPMELPDNLQQLDAFEKVLGPRLSVWVADARFVLNEVIKLNDRDARFKGRLKIDRVGYFGHSFGGASAYATLAADPRFRAGLNMDGGHFGISGEAKPSQPFFLMNGVKLEIPDASLAKLGTTRQDADNFARDVEGRWDRACNVAKGPRYRAVFPGVPHVGFSDMTLIVPLLAGDLPARKAHRLINQYTLAFFDTYLKDKPDPLLESPAADSALTFTSIRSSSLR